MIVIRQISSPDLACLIDWYTSFIGCISHNSIIIISDIFFPDWSPSKVCEEDGVFTSPNSCKQYLWCYKGEVSPLKCGDFQYFDMVSGKNRIMHGHCYVYNLNNFYCDFSSFFPFMF